MIITTLKAYCAWTITDNTTRSIIIFFSCLTWWFQTIISCYSIIDVNLDNKWGLAGITICTPTWRACSTSKMTITTLPNSRRDKVFWCRTVSTTTASSPIASFTTSMTWFTWITWIIWILVLIGIAGILHSEDNNQP